MTETKAEKVAELNVAESDMTLAVDYARLGRRSADAEALCRAHGRKFLHVNINDRDTLKSCTCEIVREARKKLVNEGVYARLKINFTGPTVRDDRYVEIEARWMLDKLFRDVKAKLDESVPRCGDEGIGVASASRVLDSSALHGSALQITQPCPYCLEALNAPADGVIYRCPFCNGRFLRDSERTVALDTAEKTDFSDGGKAFWVAVGENPRVSSSDGRAVIQAPFSEVARRAGWDPLPIAFAERMRGLISSDPLFLTSKKFSSLASMLSEVFEGNPPDELTRARWAERHMGMPLGERPNYDKDAEDRYWDERRRSGGRGRPFGGNPNARYYAWRDKRKAASRATDEAMGVLREYALRRIVRAEDFVAEKRQAMLEFLVRDLARSRWAAVSGGAGDSERRVRMTFEQFCSGGREEIRRYLEDAAEDLRAFARYSQYDLSAVARVIGPTMPQMLALIEASAQARIDGHLATACAELAQFAETMNATFGKGITRQNEMTFKCVIFKYAVIVEIVDVGKGVVAANRVRSGIGKAADVGITAAVVGAAVAFPPLLGFAAIGLMVTAALTDNGKRR